MSKILVANRGEIAIRVIRAAQELGLTSVAIYAEDDQASLHVRMADEAVALQGRGAAAYLDQSQIVALAQANQCDAIHPGYGFLSENAEFAEAVLQADMTFVGPTPATLHQFGDKTQAKSLAASQNVPVLAGPDHAVDLAQATAFFQQHASGVMLKAVSGGGGRGMRVVQNIEDLEDQFARCASEARAAFGQDAVYIEQYVPFAKHIEVQIIGDGAGGVCHVWERDCSAQRRHQKLVEVAPSPSLSNELRQAMCEAAVRLGQAVDYRGLGTIEFLLDTQTQTFYFIEANARLQVEHTVTEEVTGIDLVQSQIRIAQGHTLADLGLSQSNIPAPRGYAMQLRINMETIAADGQVKPSGGQAKRV